MKILLALVVASSLILSSCTTGFDPNSPAAQAAITAATQIAVAAANAAIQTYLSGPKASTRRLSLNNPAISVAEIATEESIAKSQPSLAPDLIHNIVVKAFNDRLAHK